jgi:hypothetical protein
MLSHCSLADDGGPPPENRRGLRGGGPENDPKVVADATEGVAVAGNFAPGQGADHGLGEGPGCFLGYLLLPPVLAVLERRWLAGRADGGSEKMSACEAVAGLGVGRTC